MKKSLKIKIFLSFLLLILMLVVAGAMSILELRKMGDSVALFIDTKSAINNLMILNQDQMYAQAAIMKENSRRSMMPGIISVVAAVLFAVLLNFFISIYFIHPIHKLIEEIKSFYPERRIIDAKITSHDEIKTLENEINSLIARLLQRTSI